MSEIPIAEALPALIEDALKLIEVKIEKRETTAIENTAGMGTIHLEQAAALFVDNDITVDLLTHICDNAEVLFSFLQHYLRCIKKGDITQEVLLRQITDYMDDLKKQQLKNTRDATMKEYLERKEAKAKAVKAESVIPVAKTVKPVLPIVKPIVLAKVKTVKVVESQANESESESDSEDDSDDNSDADENGDLLGFIAPEELSKEEEEEEDALEAAERKGRELKRARRKAAEVAEAAKREAEIKKAVHRRLKSFKRKTVTEEESTTTTTTTHKKSKTFIPGEGTYEIPFELP